MKKFVMIDLHLHSCHSYDADPTRTVTRFLDQLQATAERDGGDICFSLTDHETIMGSIEAAKILAENKEKYKNVYFIPGIESNCDFTSFGQKQNKKAVFKKVHTLAYNYDVNDKNLFVFSLLNYQEIESRGKNVAIGKQILHAKNLVEKSCNQFVSFEKFEEVAKLKDFEEIKKQTIEIMTKNTNCNAKTVEQICNNIFDVYSRNTITKTINRKLRKKLTNKEKKYLKTEQDLHKLRDFVHKTLMARGKKVYSIMEEDNIVRKFDNRTARDNPKSMAGAKVDIRYYAKMIENAGGYIGIAHPKSIKYSETKTDAEYENLHKAFFDKFEEVIGKKADFIELYRGFIDNSQMHVNIKEYCDKNNIFVTGGSDSHGNSDTIHILGRCFGKRFEEHSMVKVAGKKNMNTKNFLVSCPFVEKVLFENDEQLKNVANFINVAKGEFNSNDYEKILSKEDSLMLQQIATANGTAIYKFDGNKNISNLSKEEYNKQLQNYAKKVFSGESSKKQNSKANSKYKTNSKNTNKKKKKYHKKKPLKQILKEQKQQERIQAREKNNTNQKEQNKQNGNWVESKNLGEEVRKALAEQMLQQNKQKEIKDLQKMMEEFARNKANNESIEKQQEDPEKEM